MKRIQSGSAVPRHLVFVLADGSNVVQWNETYVQDLLTGKNRPFVEADFGHHISDYELDQLKAAGRVEQYNRSYIWLFALPEDNRFIPAPRVQEQTRDRVRGYYLNTTLPSSELVQVQTALQDAGLDSDLKAALRSDLVAVYSRNGMPFLHLKDADHAFQQAQEKCSDVFKDTVVAFVDLPARDGQYKKLASGTAELLDLGTIIAGQTDTTLTDGKQAVLVSSEPDDCEPVHKLLREMKFSVRVAARGQEALELLEDLTPNLLVTDMRIEDMHAWQMLAKIREIGTLRRMVTVVIGDANTSQDEHSFGMGITNVDVYLLKPLIISRLRHNIWLAFRRQVAEDIHV